MEIKDAISLYTFLGQLGLWGAIAFSIIIIVLIGYLVSITTEKAIENINLRKKILFTSVFISLACMIILIINSINNLSDKSDATAIKSYMVSMKWKWLGYKRLATEVNLPNLAALNINTDCKLIQKRIQHIKEIIQKFPDEFEATTVYDNYSKDSMGIELIDTNAVNVINKYNEEMLPFFRSKIISYMQASGIDTISYNDMAINIDSRLQSYLIDKIITTTNDQFIPIYTSSKEDGLVLITGLHHSKP